MRQLPGRILAILLLSAGVPAGAAKVGEPAPPFTLTTFDKAQVSLEQLRGQVVVLNYWATWCGPCKAELPAMDDYYRRHAGRGLRIFAIATEDSVPLFRLRPLAAALSFPLVAKIKGGARYGTIRNAVPTSYVIDRAGIVRYAKAGSFDARSFEATIAPLLAEPAPAAAAAVAAR